MLNYLLTLPVFLCILVYLLFSNEPRHENTNKLYGFRTGLAQTEPYKHRRWLEAGNFGLSHRSLAIRVPKTGALNSFAVTANLSYAFVFRIYEMFVLS